MSLDFGKDRAQETEPFAETCFLPSRKARRHAVDRTDVRNHLHEVVRVVAEPPTLCRVRMHASSNFNSKSDFVGAFLIVQTGSLEAADIASAMPPAGSILRFCVGPCKDLPLTADAHR